MPIGGTKVGLFAAGEAANYFGDGSLGDCQFGASAITQTGDSVAIDTVLTTGSESGGPGASSYGNVYNENVPYDTACYEVTPLSKSGSYDGDMWVGNFGTLIIDASVTLTTDQPCRGMLIYCTGDCTINGALSMSSRGAFADPESSGGSDSSAVSTTGLRMAFKTAAGSDTLAAADFAGSGNAPVAAVANQVAISGNGTIFKIDRAGGAGGAQMAAGTAGNTGAATIGAGGGAGGGGVHGESSGVGGDSGCFGGGSSGGSSWHCGGATAATDWGGAGGVGCAGSTGHTVGSGTGNPGGAAASLVTVGENGTGGLIWLVVKGDLTIGAAGTVEADGAKGGTSTVFTGSGSGGGAIFVLYKGSLTNNGSIQTGGGAGGTATSHHAGMVGGNGGHYSAQIS